MLLNHSVEDLSEYPLHKFVRLQVSSALSVIIFSLKG